MNTSEILEKILKENFTSQNLQKILCANCTVTKFIRYYTQLLSFYEESFILRFAVKDVLSLLYKHIMCPQNLHICQFYRTGNVDKLPNQ